MKAIYVLYLVVVLGVLAAVYKVYDGIDHQARVCSDLTDEREQSDCFSELSEKAKPVAEALRKATQ